MRPELKKILVALLLSLLVGLGIWYAKNRQAQNIVSGVVSSPADILKNDAGHTNLVLLGIGGEGHEGADLTDSILFVSLDLAESTATMISLPRDIWIPSMQAKINTAYHYGTERRPDGGLDLAKSTVAEILGVPIHYVVVLDFQGFVQAIDAVGGIDLEVERSFDDYKYPIPGMETAEPESARYTHLHFDAGLTHMDGSTALQFVRSRHAEGDEGTDFARGARQTKTILAFGAKLFSTKTLFNSTTLNNLKTSITDSLDTDIDSQEQGSFLKVFMALGNKDNVKNISLTDYLKNPPSTKNYGGQWVLVPTPSLEALQVYVKTKLGQ